jgi:DNA-(apurinic or apyrimidinic site) lyase
MAISRLDEFVELLAQFPSAAWNATVTEEPEWKWMRPLQESWAFGHFAALFIILGLNDYQTKGKADVGYWPKVVPLIPRESDPEDPRQLIQLLEPFYMRERFAQTKVQRLRRFVSSELCKEIWKRDSFSLAADFERIWRSLGCSMNQEPTKKTIAFAMKCLALALLMANETRFAFGAVPVPVDSRIRSISARLGLTASNDAIERERWHKTLRRIRESNGAITMVQLDSLLWQIGTLSQQEMQCHLTMLGVGQLAGRIAALFDTNVGLPALKADCRM